MNRNKIISINGKNNVLHDLNEFDVVFGTKGNGRNEIFLQVLEDHSDQYKQLSKFQKMSLIQQLIRDWRGDFYVLDSKTNELCLVKKKTTKASVISSNTQTDHHSNHDDGGSVSQDDTHESEDDKNISAMSGRLYTSVRRMMNYVITKKLDRSSNIGTPTSTSTSTTPKASTGRTKQRPSKQKTIVVNPSHPKRKATMKMMTTKTIRMMSVSSSVPNAKASITAPKLNGVLVTPEASPRTFPVSEQSTSSSTDTSSRRESCSSSNNSSYLSSPPSITLLSAAMGCVGPTSSSSMMTSFPQHVGSNRSLLHQNSINAATTVSSDHANNNGVVVDQLEVSAISVLLSFSHQDLTK